MGNTTNVQAGDLNYDRYENEIYDEDIRRSIPGHKNLHVQIERIIQEYASFHTVKKLLELGVGTGLTTQKVLELLPEASCVAVDFSAQMMNGARKRLSSYNVEFLLGDYSEMNFSSDFDVVLSVIGIHHQTNEGKKKLFQKIFDSLNTGGIFVFGDLVTYRNPQKAALNDARHYHYLVENARDEQSLEDWAHHHKFLNLLAPVEDQMEWLKEVGFGEVKVEYQYFNTALIVARK